MPLPPPLKAVLTPLKLASNGFHELFYVLDMWSEVGIKRLVSPTMTVRYNNKIERELDFSIFEVLGGVDYFSLFAKPKHIFITQYKGGPKEDDVDSYDYSIRFLFVDNGGWSKMFTIHVYFGREDVGSGWRWIVGTYGHVEGLWTASKKVMKVSLAIGDPHVGGDEKMSDNLPANVEKEYVSAFESALGRCIGF